MNNRAKHGLHGFLVAALLFAVALLVPSAARAQYSNAPAGSIFDLAATEPGTVLNTYTTFTTTFVGDGSTEYVSFAFRETPAYFLFDNASVTAQGSSTNLLSDTNFASATVGQNCNHGNSLGCPPGWGAWIQPVDVSAIGQVASTTAPYGCGNELSGVSGNFWCDGSVQGYDGIYQAVSTTNGTTYTVTWQLNDNSGSGLTESVLSDQINMLVYAGDNIPVGTVSIGPPPPPGGGTVPEPSTIVFLLAGLAVLFFAAQKKGLPNLA